MITPRFLPGTLMGAALATAVLAGCGAKVTVDTPSGTGGAGSTSTSTSSAGGAGGSGGCGGETFGCLQFCGSDFFPAQAACMGGAWVCPPGTVDPATCPKAACCSVDIDCGDELPVPCVNGVCKAPVPNGCWSDAACGPMATCVGPFVCPCGADCYIADHPGACEGPP
jgi:hypothetical protein